MKRFLLGTLALAAFTGLATAADMPVKVKAPPPVAAYDWSGIYMGFSIGYNWQHFDWAFNPATAGLVNRAYSLETDNWIFDGHGGVQAQFGWLVIGAEASYSVTSSRWASRFGFGDNPSTFSQAKVHELFTAGGRLGWTPMDNWLLYVAGGYAAGLVETRQISVATGIEFTPGHTNRWQHGWYAGAGLDWMIHKGSLVDVIVGIEYRHVELNTVNHCPPLNCNDAIPINWRDIEARMDIVHARLTIKTHGWDIFR